jgi:hypothetical protein
LQVWLSEVPGIWFEIGVQADLQLQAKWQESTRIRRIIGL